MKSRLLVLAALGLVIVAGIAAWLLYSSKAPEPAVPSGIIETGARFTSIKGDVEVKKSGSLQWVDAGMSIVLLQDDLVRTGENAEAQIKLADGTLLVLRPDSLVTILESPGSPGSRIARVEPRIDSGEANFRTGPEPEGGISGPNSRIIPDRETEGRVQVDEEGTGVEILDGGARVETETGQEVRLAPREQIQIAPDGVAGPKTTLPPPPIVMDVPKPPGLLISSVELRGDQLHLVGRTDPGVSLTVNGERIKVQPDGSFTEHVVMPPGTTTLSIRATGKDGAVTEQRLPLKATG